ncbi:MAG: RelA/SpoT domain-containing protein, partial [Treponema sp.]|nr:RelA/SpoT domain-containing protein [Treponema sp.]
MNFPDRTTIKKQYDAHSGVRRLVVKDLVDRFEEVLCGLPSRPAVRGRQKDFDSFYRKYLKLLKSQQEPVLTDLIGIRVICPFLEDLRLVEKTLRKHFSVLEVDKKGAHFSFKEFGYESTHLLINIPPEIIKRRGNADCSIAEVQVRTILQDAWAEVEHELVYKAEFTPF